MRLEPGSEHYKWSVSPLDAWRLLTEPMSREEATIAANAVTRALPHVHAFPADPRTNLVTVWDRPTAELIRDALTAIVRTGSEVPAHIISNIDEWLALADPRDDPAVPLVEDLLTSAATRHAFKEHKVDGRQVATRALWICACETMQDSPTWVIYDSPDGSGIAWCRIPDGPLDIEDVVDARRVAGGHTAPERVLRWLRGDVHWSTLNIDGDVDVVGDFEPRLRDG
jgi:hypothetical protein